VNSADRLSRVDALLGIAMDGTAAAIAGGSGGVSAPHNRAAAFLLRRALEDRLDSILGARHPVLLRCAARTRIAWLAQHVGTASAGRYATTWHCLSLACHYHRSVLPPTRAELRGWRDDVAAVLRELQTL
jgi:hypothetical protein